MNAMTNQRHLDVSDEFRVSLVNSHQKQESAEVRTMDIHFTIQTASGIIMRVFETEVLIMKLCSLIM